MPFWSQVGPKSRPKCYPRGVLFLIAFGIDFCSIFLGFLVQLGTPEPLIFDDSTALLKVFALVGQLLLDGVLGAMFSPT